MILGAGTLSPFNQAEAAMFLLTTRGRLLWLKQGMLRGGATRRPIVSPKTSEWFLRDIRI